MSRPLARACVPKLFHAQATKVELAATRGVVTEQASTEGALLSEAAQTAESLGAAERDVEGLLDKVARQVGTVPRACRKYAGAVVGCSHKEARRWHVQYPPPVQTLIALSIAPRPGGRGNSSMRLRNALDESFFQVPPFFSVGTGLVVE